MIKSAHRQSLAERRTNRTRFKAVESLSGVDDQLSSALPPAVDSQVGMSEGQETPEPFHTGE